MVVYMHKFNMHTSYLLFPIYSEVQYVECIFPYPYLYELLEM